MSTLFLTLVFGMLDMGLTLFHTHVASEAARQGARTAIVHGYLAPNDSTMNAWGPTPSYYPALVSRSIYADAATHSVRADHATDELAGAIRPYLVGLDPGTVDIRIHWPDGNNEPGNRVTVSVSFPYRHLIPWFVRDNSTTLGASSTMTVIH
jgi:hypothetical protein